MDEPVGLVLVVRRATSVAPRVAVNSSVVVRSWMPERLGTRWEDHGLVFPREDGRWWNPPAVSVAFRRAVRRAGVPRIRMHDLRHTHATLLLVAGVNPKVVSERLGHSSVAFTLDTYAHVMPGMQPDAAQLFMNLVYDHPEEARR